MLNPVRYGFVLQLASIGLLSGLFSAVAAARGTIQVQIIVDVSGSVGSRGLSTAVKLVQFLHSSCFGKDWCAYRIDLLASHIEHLIGPPAFNTPDVIEDFRKQFDSRPTGTGFLNFTAADLNKTDFTSAFDAIVSFLGRQDTFNGGDPGRKVVWLITDGKHDPFDDSHNPIPPPFDRLTDPAKIAAVPFDLFLIYVGPPDNPGLRSESDIRAKWEQGMAADMIHFVFEDAIMEHLQEELVGRMISKPVFALKSADCWKTERKDGSTVDLFARTEVDGDRVSRFDNGTWKVCGRDDGDLRCYQRQQALAQQIGMDEVAYKGSIALDRDFPWVSVTLELRKSDRFQAPWVWSVPVCSLPDRYMQLQEWSGLPTGLVNQSFRVSIKPVSVFNEQAVQVEVPVTASVRTQEPGSLHCDLYQKGTLIAHLTVHPSSFTGPAEVKCSLTEAPWLPDTYPFPVIFKLNGVDLKIAVKGEKKWELVEDEGHQSSMRFLWLGFLEVPVVSLFVFLWLFRGLLLWWSTAVKKWYWMPRLTLHWDSWWLRWDSWWFAWACLFVIAWGIQEPSKILEVLKLPIYQSRLCEVWTVQLIGGIIFGGGCILCALNPATPPTDRGILWFVAGSVLVMYLGVVGVVHLVTDEVVVGAGLHVFQDFFGHREENPREKKP